MSKIKYVHTLERHQPKDAFEILPYVFDLFDPSSLLDVGCANGSWLHVAKQLGVEDVFGMDGIEVEESIKFLDSSEFLKHDLKEPIDLGRRFDMVISLEVAEHLPENSADSFVSTLVKHSDIIVFSAAVPGQGGQFHINEQWPDYWQSKFENNGFLAFDLLRDKFWDNVNVFWW